MGVNLSGRRGAAGPAPGAPNPLFLRDEELSRGVELLEAAARTLQADADRRLSGHGLTRNHQRVLRAIARQPGVTMARLGTVLGLTKQSLSRLLAELGEKGLVQRGTDPHDRRQRPIELSGPGRELAEQLESQLRRRLAGAYRAAGAEAVAGCHEVLLGLVDERTRRRLQDGV